MIATMDVDFKAYEHGKSRYNGRISEDEWNKHKPKLEELHNLKMTRQQILDIISADFGDTKPTYGQLCTKFDKWGFHVYRVGPSKKKEPRQKTKVEKIGRPEEAFDPIPERELKEFQPFTPESQTTIVPGFEDLNFNDSTPTNTTEYYTPRSIHTDPSIVSESTPRAPGHSRNTSGQPSIYDFEPSDYSDIPSGDYPYDHQNQQWLYSGSTLPDSGQRSSVMSDFTSSKTPLSNTTTESINVEPDDPPTIAARTRRADETLDAITSYLRSIGQTTLPGGHVLSMTSLAAYLFATRSYSAAFRIYRKIYTLMSQDGDDVSKLGALMRCFQSAVEPEDLQFMEEELHEVLNRNSSDSSLNAFTAQMLQSVEVQISQGFNLAQGTVLSTSSIARNLNHLAVKGCSSEYPGTRRLYWRLRLMKHSPFHSGCKRLLRLMSELLSWSWAAMAVVKFPQPALQNIGCLCKDGLYFDFVRMVTTVIMEAAMGFEISQLIRIPAIKQTPCDCVMCADLESTFQICSIETFTAIAMLTVDRCRLDWTSCHPGGRHQELTPSAILNQQLLPTIESLLQQVVQVAADVQGPTTIHTSDLYDDFLSCIWLCFETHDLPLRNARFEASPEKVEDVLTTLITEELDKSHPARQSTLNEGKMPVFSYGENNSELANKITAKRTRSNASSLKPSSSNASERSMIRIRKKLKYRSSVDYLNSMASYSSLSSRNSVNNRFSYVTGLPELETVMDDEELRAQLPPDLTPDEFRSMQRHDSWSKRSDHFSWVPSRPGSTVSRGYSWRESNMNMAPPFSRPGSVQNANSVNRRPSQKDTATPHGQALRNSLAQQQQSQSQSQNQNQNQNQNQQQTHNQYQQYQQYQQQQNATNQLNIINHNNYNHNQDHNQNQLNFAQHQQQLQQNQRAQQQNVPMSGTHQQNFASQWQQPQSQPPQYSNRMPTQVIGTTSTPQHHQIQISNHNKNANGSSTSVHSSSGDPKQQSLKNPQRRDSTKTTRSKESQKGRWSSERDRVENVLRAMP